jgi:hypothetical protein
MSIEDKRLNLNKIEYREDGIFDKSKHMECYVDNMDEEQIRKLRDKRAKSQYFRNKYRQNPDVERERQHNKYHRLDKHRENRNKKYVRKDPSQYKKTGRPRKY